MEVTGVITGTFPPNANGYASIQVEGKFFSYKSLPVQVTKGMNVTFTAKANQYTAKDGSIKESYSINQGSFKAVATNPAAPAQALTETPVANYRSQAANQDSIMRQSSLNRATDLAIAQGKYDTTAIIAVAEQFFTYVSTGAILEAPEPVGVPAKATKAVKAPVAAPKVEDAPIEEDTLEDF
jgi:hypothetical protein